MIARSTPGARAASPLESARRLLAGLGLFLICTLLIWTDDA